MATSELELNGVSHLKIREVPMYLASRMRRNRDRWGWSWLSKRPGAVELVGIVDPNLSTVDRGMEGDPKWSNV